MTREEKLKLLEGWKKCHDDNEALLESMKPIFGYLVESHIFKQLWSSFNYLTLVTETLLGSESEWLDWYCWENDMGKKGLEAGYDKNIKPIKSLNDLLDLIEK
jgi:hypothetical protein